MFFSGRPRPQVTWWNEGELLDSVSEENQGDITVNSLYLSPLTRKDLYKKLTCQASNYNNSKPLDSSVTLDMTCKYYMFSCKQTCLSVSKHTE